MIVEVVGVDGVDEVDGVERMNLKVVGKLKDH